MCVSKCGCSTLQIGEAVFSTGIFQLLAIATVMVPLLRKVAPSSTTPSAEAH